MGSRFMLAQLLIALGATSAPCGAQSVTSLPDYKPQQTVSGTIRASGDRAMAGLMNRWEAGFKRYHPGVQFIATLNGTASGVYGLEMRTADIALMGRPLNPFERYGTYERSWTYPVEIEVATGSARSLHKSPALAIFVHKANPLARLTLAQLDGIFGAQRGGGWQALSWIESAARSAAGDIRTWGALGLGGAWSDKPIHVYGPPLLGPGAVSFFQVRVLHGGAMWNEDLREYADRRAMLADLSHDPFGIAYAPLAYESAGVKAVALAQTAAGPFVKLTADGVRNRSYPLARPVYIDYTIDDEKSEIARPRPDPKVKEFLRYVLSRRGQADIANEGAYLALPAAMVDAQRKLLDWQGIPPERKLVTPTKAPS